MTKSAVTSSLLHSPRIRLWFWLGGIILFFVFLSLIRSILLPFVVGMLAAYFLDPAVQKLRKWGLSRTLSAAVITLGFFALAVTACSVLAPLIAHQLAALVNELPDHLQILQDKYSDTVGDYVARLSPDQAGAIQNAVSTMSAAAVDYAGKMASDVLRSGLALLDILSLVFLTPVVAFYLLRDWQQVVRRVDEMLPRNQAPVIRGQLAIIDQTLSGFIRGQTNVCLIMACYYGILLSLIGLKFGLGLGILTGLFLFVPFVGIITGFTLSMIAAFFQFGAGTDMVFVAAIYAAGMMLESGIITPRLVGGKVGLHPLWIIFGILAGGALFGVVGVLIAVPVTSVLGVLVRFGLEHYLQSPLYRSA